MSRKTVVYLGVTIGSTIGGFIPTLWGANFLSYSSVIATAIGGLIGLVIAYKISA